MLIGYMRVSKADGTQTTDLQKDALLAAEVEEDNIYEDFASGKLMERPQLEACLRALRSGDTLLVWKLDRLGRSLKHLVEIVDNLKERDVGFKVLTGYGANIDTTTPNGYFAFGIFAALAEYERQLISERTKAALAAARARGRMGGRRHKLTPHQVMLAQASMQSRETNLGDLCQELGITKPTLYRYVGPDGTPRLNGMKVLGKET